MISNFHSPETSFMGAFLRVTKWKIISLCKTAIILLASFNTMGQNVGNEFETKGLMKISIYPMVWAAVKGNIWITAQYEGEINRRERISYNLVLEYSNKPDMIFYFRPQIRHYFGKAIYRGYYFGLFPLYHHRNMNFEMKEGNYLGGGLISGYQFFLKRKYPIEINFWMAYHIGRFSKTSSITGQKETGQENFSQLGFELNIELPIIRKKQ